MRIPLVPSLFQAVMSGLSQGTTMAHEAEQNAALAAQTTNMQKLLALKQQLEPAQLAEMGAATNASLGATALDPAKLKMYLAQAAAARSGAANKTQLTQAQTNELNAQAGFMGSRVNAIQNVIKALQGSQNTNPPAQGGMTSSGLPLAPQPTTTQNPASNNITPVDNSGASSPQVQTLAALAGWHLPTAQQLETPAEKAQLQTQVDAKSQQSAANIKKITTAQSAIAEDMKMIDLYHQIIPVIQNNPTLFHPGSSLVQYIDPKEARGKMIGYSADLIASLSKQLNTRGTNFSNKTAKNMKPSIDDYPSMARGKAYGGIGSVQQDIKAQIRNIQEAGGNPNTIPNLSYYTDPNLARDPLETVTVKLPNGNLVHMSRSDAIKGGATESAGIGP